MYVVCDAVPLVIIQSTQTVSPVSMPWVGRVRTLESHDAEKDW
jgi:hypothetical protein